MTPKLAEKRNTEERKETACWYFCPAVGVFSCKPTCETKVDDLSTPFTSARNSDPLVPPFPVSVGLSLDAL
ncbi:hypothetical protein ZHAS_00017416 [Anopheles sinensis]|uniref:Uncharacterized protein n=1 Tax=Anopheles sinensis TaxID=74873 RepID=A0A084WGF7_ANOSI|nr:hypothetical protein ZHAS_00017416 [Anopheles sinensis]